MQSVTEVLSQRFTNKTVVITGGNSGIGYATARRIIQEGGTAIILGRDSQKLQDAQVSLGDRCHYYVVDIGRLDQVEQVFAKIKADFDILHGLFVNAGVALIETWNEISEKSFDQTVDVNLKGAFFTVQHAVPLMHQGGAVLFNASLAAHRTFTGGAIYAATKAALRSLAASLALELAAHKIRVNSISPGTVITPLFDKLGMSPEDVQEFIKHYKSKIPLDRAADPDEIASVVAFFLSEDSSFVTGTDLLADGGLASCVK